MPYHQVCLAIFGDINYMGTNDINVGSLYSSRKTLDLIMLELEEAKANDVSQLDVRALTDITDFMVIASGTSHRHVHAMADRIREAARRQSLRPIGIEGDSENDWILIDFSDVVVHLMIPKVRQFYGLEQLWNDNLSRESKLQNDSVSDQ